MENEYGLTVTSSLQQSVKSVQAALKKLDAITGNTPAKSRSRYLPRQKATKIKRIALTKLEKLTEPLVKEAASAVLGSGGTQAINLAMNLIGSQTRGSRLSQGQIAAQAATAISRAMQRNL